MRSERVTVLMKPAEKAALEAKAAKRGVSSGEYLRLAVVNFEEVSPEEEDELAALVAEASIAIPKMAKSLESTCEKLEAIHKETDEFLRRMGVRK